MIPERFITQWSQIAPWGEDKQVEQDLLICRALCAIYNDEFLSHHLAFRGGTALGKLYLSPQPRYSEDIDLVQIHAEPIGETLSRLRSALSFLGEPEYKKKRFNNTFVFHVESSDPVSREIGLKVEINCMEHFSVFPYRLIPFTVDSGWFYGSCELLTFELEELAGTKLRAMYQRRKSRDLFDLFRILQMVPNLEKDKVIECFQRYLSFVATHIPTYKEMVLNMNEKMLDDEYHGDISGLLRPGVVYDPMEAYQVVHDELLVRMKKP